MKAFFNQAVAFAKREIVLAAATILAVISAFWVHPSMDYVSYIDFRVLGILLSLMLVMAGFQRSGMFARLGTILLQKTKGTGGLLISLVFLCFFTAMFITNDVALITFVPFAMLTLKQSGQEQQMIPVIVLQTLAANLGSMLTPIGNPQNLYLYNIMGISLGSFLLKMLPVTVASGVLLLVCCLVIGKQGTPSPAPVRDSEEEIPGNWRNLLYLGLFLCCLLVVVRVLPWEVVLAGVVLAMFFADRGVLRSVDYNLLLTFVAFFIFTGNIGNISAVRTFLQQLVVGRELWVSIAASQVISNVPAALLLAGFTEDFGSLLMGVNLGGLGTLIASMASLISYKLYAKSYDGTKGKYLLVFTGANIAFLVILVVISQIF